MFDPTRDAALMARVRGGDAAAFSELYDLYAQVIASFLYHMCWDREKAADGVQEVFLRLWRGARLWNDTGKFSTYLFQIARNYWLNEIARESRRVHPVPLAPDEPLVDHASRVPDPGPGPSGRAEDRETAEAIRGAVDALPEKLRVAFVLGEYQGMKYSEIAEILDIPVGTVKSRMFAAEQLLRKALRRHMG